jgi:hypothetical protein
MVLKVGEQFVGYSPMIMEFMDRTQPGWLQVAPFCTTCCHFKVLCITEKHGTQILLFKLDNVYLDLCEIFVSTLTRLILHVH